MNEYTEKYIETTELLLMIEDPDKIFDSEETRMLLKIYRRRALANYDCSKVKLVKSTENRNYYDITLYHNGNKTKTQHLIDESTYSKNNKIDEHISDSQMSLIKEVKTKKTKTKNVFTPSEYVLNFGKYAGRRMSSLTSDEEIQYCQWMLKQLRNDPMIKKNNRKLLAFEWHNSLKR